MSKLTNISQNLYSINLFIKIQKKTNFIKFTAKQNCNQDGPKVVLDTVILIF